METKPKDGSESEKLTREKLPEYQINGFISAVGRARWFLLSTVLVATMILAQTYVEWNHCEAQRIVMAALHERLLLVRPDQKPVEALTESLANDLSQLRATDNPTPAEIIQLVAAANTLVERRRIVNMLNDVKPHNQGLWMLPFNVPAGDFLPIMSLVLLVFSICLWLSGRAMVLTVRQCECDELRDIARMYLLFSLPRRRPTIEAEGNQQGIQAPAFSWWTGADWWAKAPELVALAAPSMALTLATLHDWTTTRMLIRAGDFTASVHFRFLIANCLILIVLGLASMWMALALDRELYQHCSLRIRASTGASNKADGK
jgi:hypothetical protein